jgi:hypothetical protein
VSTFRLGHITMSPVLIISYEVSVRGSCCGGGERRTGEERK